MRTIRPITEEDKLALYAAAAADAHTVLWPTHVVVDGENAIMGYLSIMATPIVQVWMDSKKNSARDSLSTLKQLDDALRVAGHKEYSMPCCNKSPYFKVMEKMGFQKIGSTVMFRKSLRTATGEGIK